MNARQPANVACQVCGRPVDTCNVPGLHGMIRERARIAAGELAARAVVATYGADAVARTIADADSRGIAVSPFLRRAASGTLPGKAVR